MIQDQNTLEKVTGFYRGEVVQLREHGKVKLFIPGVYPEKWRSEPESLPDAEQISPLFAGCYDGNGVFSYPKLSSIVRCGFWNGDINYPWYDGACLGGINALSNGFNNSRCEVTDSPNNAYVHKINAGNTEITINDIGFVRITTKCSGTSCDMCLDSDGNIILSSSNKISINALSIELSAGNQISLTTSSGNTIQLDNINTVLKSQSITLNGSDSTIIRGGTAPQIGLI